MVGDGIEEYGKRHAMPFSKENREPPTVPTVFPDRPTVPSDGPRVRGRRERSSQAAWNELC